MRQQRTRANRGIDPGQQPLPIFLLVEEITAVSSTVIDLTYSQPIIVSGIPSVVAGSNPVPLSAVQTDVATVRLTYADPVPYGSLLLLEDWDTRLRGLNGEWCEGFRLALGQGETGELPALVWPVDFLITDPESVTVTWNAAHTALGLPAVTAFGVGAATGASIISPTQVEYTFPGTVPNGTHIQLGPWDPGGVSSAGVWIAPFDGVAVEP